MRTTRLFSQQPTTIAVFSLLISFNLSLAEVFRPRLKSPPSSKLLLVQTTLLGVYPVVRERLSFFISTEFEAVTMPTSPLIGPKVTYIASGFCAVSREYDQVFQPAAVAGDRRPFCTRPENL